MTSVWQDLRVCVTGGASFIGSHLVDALIARGASVRVVDDLSSGTLDNLADASRTGRMEFIESDLREPDAARDAVRDTSIVFHLAADHGGRGYIDLHQASMSGNLALDQNVFRSALEAGCEKVVYASSGCVYPLYLQTDAEKALYLREDDVGPPYEPDGLYGLAKLAGEMTLKALHTELGFPSASLRYFTVYGPRGVENHAVMAMIARAFIGEDPFEVWGTGEQIRNWTYVDDIVSGTIIAAERVADATTINLGTTERVRVIDAAKIAMDLAGSSAEIRLRPDAPTGPLNRVASNELADRILGWRPEVLFSEGIRRTYEWYVATKKQDEVRSILDHMLTERNLVGAASKE